MNSVWLAFLTGLTTGGLSCIAVQGGLLASSIASVTERDPLAGAPQSFIKNWRIVGIFLVTKLIGYTMLGFALGSLGSLLTLSPKIFGTVQILAGLFMLATAARILDIHPIFRYAVIQPPRWIYRVLRNRSKDASMIGPAFLGLFTVLMPCGVTQATMAVAVATGNPFLGAAIMFAFVLGTSPIFFALGASVVELLNRKTFSFVAAGVVAVFAVFSINGGLALRGSFLTIQNLWRAATISPAELARLHGQIAGVSGGQQNVTIEVLGNGYVASATTLQAGVPVRLSLVTNNVQGCTRMFTIPDLNISRALPQTGTEIIEFVPERPGRLAYACGMGMFTGEFQIVGGGTL